MTVLHKTKLPINFDFFLRNSKSKEELFVLLTEELAACDYQADKEVRITFVHSVDSMGSSDPIPEADLELSGCRRLNRLPHQVSW